MFPHLKLLCWLFMGLTLGFDAKQRNRFLKSNLVFFLVLLGLIISRFFACSNEEKNKPKQQWVRALVLSLWF
jgi:hypothetical protein